MSQGYVTLTRERTTNQAWKQRLAVAGYQIYELPCIETSLSPLTPRTERIMRQLEEYDWVVFSSTSGVAYFKLLADQLEINLKSLAKLPLAAVGGQTAAAATKLGLSVKFTPTRADSLSLAQQLPDVAKKKILLVRADIAGKEPLQILKTRLADIAELAIYHTEPIRQPDPAFHELLITGKISALVFASPSAFTGFRFRVGSPADFKRAQAVPVVAVGPRLAADLADAGFLRIKTALAPNIEGIMAQLSQLLD